MGAKLVIEQELSECCPRMRSFGLDRLFDRAAGGGNRRDLVGIDDDDVFEARLVEGMLALELRQEPVALRGRFDEP